jgi:hypothetical protein
LKPEAFTVALPGTASMFSTSYNVPSCNPRLVALSRIDGREYKDPAAYTSISSLYETILISITLKLNGSAYKSWKPGLLLKLGKPWVRAPNERVESTVTKEKSEEVVM